MAGLLAACLALAAVSSGTIATAARSAAAAADPAGFSVNLPHSWTLQRGAQGRLDLAGPGGASGVIWPVFVAGRLNPGTAAVAVRAFTKRLAGNVRWEAPRAVSAGVVGARGVGSGRSAVALLRYAASGKGSAAVLFLASAPKAVARSAATAFAGIFGSFKLTGATVGTAAGAALAYTRWRDPREGAFSLEVPTGWTVSGGLTRKAALDFRGSVAIVSPDKNVSLLIGDPTLGTFTVPNQLLAIGGFSEGSTYSPGYGLEWIVRHYIPGVAFASRYAVQLAQANSCTGVQVLQQRARPDAVAQMNEINRRYEAVGASIQIDAGEVSFSCSIGPTAISAYVFAGTQLTTIQPTSLWQVPYLFVATARNNSMALAEAVLRHAVASYQLDPAWAAGQQGLAANVSKIVTETSNAISNTISSTYWNKVAVDDRLSRQQSNTTLGLTDTIDPSTGRTFKVESSSSYHWIDTQGRIVGTNTDAQPGVNFRQLVQLP